MYFVWKLALKHRQNKSQRQRIIVFVCSPVEEEEKKLDLLAKKMKKGNVSIDFVVFGELDDDDTTKKLQSFNESVKGSEGSHLVVVPPSSKLLSDQLISTPILLGENAPGGSGGGMNTDGSGSYGEFDFDPSMDPELALALRMSMEEEKTRQEKKAREEKEAAQKASLEAVPEDGPEEDESAKPLLDKDGQPSGSGESSEKKDDKEDKPGDSDKMDTT
jgi:26S proteasome regulatory subunit N10